MSLPSGVTLAGAKDPIGQDFEVPVDVDLTSYASKTITAKDLGLQRITAVRVSRKDFTATIVAAVTANTVVVKAYAISGTIAEVTGAADAGKARLYVRGR